MKPLLIQCGWLLANAICNLKCVEVIEIVKVVGCWRGRESLARNWRWWWGGLQDRFNSCYGKCDLNFLSSKGLKINTTK
jgi:hypothetical protein